MEAAKKPKENGTGGGEGSGGGGTGGGGGGGTGGGGSGGTGGGEGSGGGGAGGRCFIASAAYGSDIAPEVQFLRELRDNALCQTGWGRQFFADFYREYYRISPPIAQGMESDPQLKRSIRWSIVEPWTHYMRLLSAQPNWDRIDYDSLQPELREFVLLLRKDMQAWLNNIDLPTSFADVDCTEAVKELNVILGFVRRSGGLAYLRELSDRGELPLSFEPQEESQLLSLLQQGGRSEEEIRLILYRSQ
ncbi:MAG TPA: CFI-box-CTERM domain-containing protein [Pyrinomonadaceae bacterium]|nr:CFI-box-CTERM domain-containing protein [Pyrinomonadaceae bacterium]